MRGALRIAVLLLPLVAGGAPAAARELYWESVDVRARLDAEGLLHIEERQAMVFTGDWNGGERTFRLLGAQKVKLHDLRRVEPDTGREISLVKGDLSQVDHYDWTDSTTLRWRSRLTSDPEFHTTRITYILDYTLSRTLDRLDDTTYRIEPDFVFPDRAGPIERFSLDFDVDPVWQPLHDFPRSLERNDLAPGQSVVVGVDLRYTGSGSPSSMPKPIPEWLRFLIFGGALAAMIAFVVELRHHEGTTGRFDPPPIPEDLDRSWLEEHVLTFEPELAGALWDRAVGPPEVAAVLARLVAEGKLESEVVARPWYRGGDLLRLRRKVPNSRFETYERRLVSGLFVGDDDETDTDRVRKYYRSKSKGFDPAGAMRNELLAKLERTLRQKLGRSAETPAPTKRRTAAIFFAFLGSFVLAALFRPEVHLVLGVVMVPLLVLTLAIGHGAANAWSRRVDRRWVSALGFLVPALVLWAASLGIVVFGNLVSPTPMSLFGELAFALLPVIVISSLARRARTRDNPDVVRARQHVIAARRLLRAELARAHPKLEDAWLPYLLAFGLERDVDRWFRAFAGVTGDGSSAFTGGGIASASASGTSSGGWTGGGGSFGGAGATASWAVAARGMAAGVSPPGSSGGSSGGGGGGGGGGSSGGGGGGGW